MQRQILHCDMNNFYASVECMLNPKLRDKIVAVGGSVEERHGIILAKNYAAKKFGITTGEAIWQAKQKCKDLIIVPPNYEQYLKFSLLAREIYARYTDQIEPYGMDECWLDITGSNCFGSSVQIAEQIRKTIKFELGLTISIGVSFNKIFAKLGSDMKKPDAITVIGKDTFKNQIWGLPASELLGVGRATDKKLKANGIRTIGELASTHEDTLKRLFGINGIKLKQFASGEDVSKVTHENYSMPIKSVGHGITTLQDLESNAEVWCVLLQLVQNVSTRLRKHGKKACGVSIYVRENTLQSSQHQCVLPVPTHSGAEIAKAAFELFCKRYTWENDIRAITIKAINLIEADTPLQCDFFTNTRRVEKRENLEVTIEKLRGRFGKDIVKNAVLCKYIKLPKNTESIVVMPTGMIQ